MKMIMMRGFSDPDNNWKIKIGKNSFQLPRVKFLVDSLREQGKKDE